VAIESAPTQSNPVRIKLEDGSLFVCPCGSNEFKVTNEGVEFHLFCRCGQVYVANDLPPVWEVTRG